jgi:hypothetical protein
MQNFLYFLKTYQYPIINIILNSIIISAILLEIIPVVKYSNLGLPFIILVLFLSCGLLVFNILQFIVKTPIIDTTIYSIILIGVIGLIAWDIKNNYNTVISSLKTLPIENISDMPLIIQNINKTR